MIKEGDLIGIAHSQVYFVGLLNEDNLVKLVDIYTPVSLECYQHMKEKKSAISYDEYDSLREDWVEAVNDGETDLGYHAYASKLFDAALKEADPENKLWFYGQNMMGAGMKLVEDLGLHNQVKSDMEKTIRDDYQIGSWDYSETHGPWMAGDFPWRDGSFHKGPIKWDHVYNREAADACETYRKLYLEKEQKDDDTNRKTD